MFWKKKKKELNPIEYYASKLSLNQYSRTKKLTTTQIFLKLSRIQTKLYKRLSRNYVNLSFSNNSQDKYFQFFFKYFLLLEGEQMLHI